MLKKVMNIMGIRRRVVLNHSDNQGIVVLQVLTDDEERQIEKSEKKYGGIVFALDKKYKINSDSIYLYGDIDLSNEEDIKILSRFRNKICNEYSAGNFIYSNIDYNTGNVTAEDNIFKGYDCMNWYKWFKYNYLLIGKPKKIIIYSIPKRYILKEHNWGKM